MKVACPVRRGGWGNTARLCALPLPYYNKKTVTVITDEGQRWNVSPSFLRKAEPNEVADTD